MAWQSLDDQTEIRGIFDTIIQKGAAIEVHFPGEEEVFFSRALAISPGKGGVPQETEEPSGIVLRDLSPRHGNEQIHNSAECEILFSFRRFFCRFRSAVLCAPAGSPHLGHLVEYPASVEVEEKRREERFVTGSPGFFAAVFRCTDSNREPRTFDLSILNYSKHGLGLLVRKSDFPLLPLVQPGDPIDDLTLYGETLLMNLSMIVRHKSEIEEGPLAGNFLLGLQSKTSLQGRFDALSMGSHHP